MVALRRYMADEGLVEGTFQRTSEALLVLLGFTYIGFIIAVSL
jgi:hypothetical protein